MAKLTGTGLRSSGMLRGIGWSFGTDQLSAPRDTPEERRHQLHRGRSRMTRKIFFLQHFAFSLSVVVPTVHHIQSSVKGMVMCPGPVPRETALSTVTSDVNCKYGAWPFLSDFEICCGSYSQQSVIIHNIRNTCDKMVDHRHVQMNRC